MSNGNSPVREFDRGELVVKAGDKVDCFSVVLEGHAKVDDVFDDIPELNIGPGELIGEMGLLFEGIRRRTIIALTRILTVTGTRQELEQALNVEEIGSHVASIAAQRFSEAVEPILT